MSVEHQGDENRGTPAITTDEIESLCIVYAVGDGCALDDLAARLGLSPTLAAAMPAAVAPLAAIGLLEVHDGTVCPTLAG
ncbi:MAG TPA: hypothetical protein PKA88_17030, partial [Polyangiaceae bacterium]|nr:hypothetical protein [Polyangiaceae bacterium]